MAAKHFYRQGFLLLLFNFISTAALEKRFSDLKRCADEECSMLLCRGKAVTDFTGPDCRFLSFKKSETIYVYYKLAGRRTDMWAGSVGSSFGYFPNYLIAVNHHYTDKEIEVPSEETDFVCFDTGFDKFDNYNVDILLGSLVGENDGQISGTPEVTQVVDDINKETQSLEEETETKKQSEHQESSQEENKVSVDQDALSPEPEEVNQLPSMEEATSEYTEKDEEHSAEMVHEKVLSETSDTKETSTHPEVESVPENNFPPVSEGKKIPKLKTTFGTTFDAVISDEKITTKVTTYEDEEESTGEESQPADSVGVVEETPLLSFSEETANTPEIEIESVTKEQIPPEIESVSVSEGAQIPELKTTFGSTFDAVISDEDITTKVTPYEDEVEDISEKSPPADDDDVPRDTPLLSFLEETTQIPEFEVESGTDDDFPTVVETVSVSEGTQVPELKTTFGSTFDAVTTNEDITTKVTTYEDEEVSTSEESPPADDDDVPRDTPLLSFSEETTQIPELEVESGTDDDFPTEIVTDSVSEGTQIPKLKTTFGTTFDAVTTNEDFTTKVTPYEEEEEDKDLIKDREDHVDVIRDTPLLSFSEDTVDSSVPDSLTQQEAPPVEQEEKEPAAQVKSMWTTLGDAVFSVVTGGETTPDTSSEEDEDDDEEEEAAAAQEIPEVVEEVRKDVEEEEPEIIEHIHSSGSVSVQQDELETEPDIGTTDEPFQHKLEKEELSNDLDHVVEDIQTDHTLDSSEAEAQQDMGTKDEDSQPGLPDVEPEFREDPPTEEEEHEKEPELQEENVEEKEELLEDENAIFSDDTEHHIPSNENETVTPELASEPEYSDSVKRLTLLRSHFTEEAMKRVQKHLGLKNLYKVEAMYVDLEMELQLTRHSHKSTMHEIESSLEAILEASENSILDQVENMLDNNNKQRGHDLQLDMSSLDEETQILDDFQELAFSLRQKYSTASDSTPLATENVNDQGQPELITKEDLHYSDEEDKLVVVPESEGEDNLTVAHHEENPTEEQRVHSVPDVSVEEDGGRFNKNKENQLSDDIQKVPQPALDNPLEMGLGVEVEHSHSGPLDSVEPVSEINEVEEGLIPAGLVDLGSLLSSSKIEEWTVVMISLLPEEWKPGETLYGCPWQAVVVTALIGVMTFALFLWKTVLAVKKKEYLVDEKKLTEQIQALKQEKNKALAKISELQKQTEKLKENQKQSKDTVSTTVKKIQNLENKVSDTQSLNERITNEKNTIAKLLEEERASSMQYEARIEKLEKAHDKLQLSKKKIQDVLAKTTALLDEAKLREDARNVQHKCLEKEYTALKEQNRTHKSTIKGWEDKHKELSEQIKTYQKSEKELQDSLEVKDHTIEVLSELLADLDTCDLPKGEKLVANGEILPDKKAAIKNRIKEMMDVSRVQTTLTVVEEQRDRFMSKLLSEEKARKVLEEQHQELEHAIGTIKSEKSYIENQLKVLQQKNEIMVEMYQQKENALQQKLTKEELERRSKETLLSEVGGKAVEAEEQVKLLRQRISEMEEQMKKTEEVYKEQIKEQENKTHSNWVNARNAERALNQEKVESSKLRDKLALMNSQLNERRASLFRPNSGQPAGPRQGDSYAPSPVSGGQPSPPPMIEGPRRPPSAPVGRRIDPFGPRPPSDPHGRFADNKHISGIDMMGPRSSSPANMDVSTQEVDPQVKAEAQAEVSTESPEPVTTEGPGSFLASPIRDSPGPMVKGPPPGPGPHDPPLPPGPHGRLPPPRPYGPPRPGPYHHPPGPLPPNLPHPVHGAPPPPGGHPGLPLRGPMGGEFGPRPINGHVYPPRPPLMRPPLPHPYRPMSPPQSHRGPIGPRPPMHPDMRFPGSRDHSRLPLDLPHPHHPDDIYRHALPPSIHQNSVAPHSLPGQDPTVQQAAPQDSAGPAVVKP
ncbi:transport and Golgi organization protein 1 homolog isoform X2 [Cynoglossus semilaevis]|uniref:transport and Golgi organization protein 1 homolog isoform X2 n=1 Tax=Cynoglossus semilaevis TaxID=244447 RepID=UPI0007DCACA6|nr:transport and Golgi organization protein 1 homolog isoform X2 [Cynoglossus semilaevis]